MDWNRALLRKAERFDRCGRMPAARGCHKALHFPSRGNPPNGIGDRRTSRLVRLTNDMETVAIFTSAWIVMCLTKPGCRF
jgi:hypothetical protein